MNTKLKYIIVDDDPFNNMICTMNIKDAVGEADTKTFTHPEEGLLFIENSHITDPTILFLDINMPTLTGWEFLEQYEKFADEIKMQINIYLLSSSIDHRDKDRADINKNVMGFISKPLKCDTIISIANAPFRM